MTYMTGGQAIVKTLVRHGVDTVFGLPGIQLDHLFDAFYEHRDALRVIHTRHEQGAAYMALGYARTTGRPGVFAVVPGPGVLNASCALCTAEGLSSPVLCLTGTIASHHLGLGLGMAHELRDQEQALRGIVGYVKRADRPRQAPAMLRGAFRHMLAGRQRAAVFEMPPDVMGRQDDVKLLAPERHDQGPAPDAGLIEEAAMLLGRARFPAIFVGGGIYGAENELRELAETLQAPVIMSESALGALSDRHPLALGAAAGYRVWKEVDVALAVGTRFLGPALAWGRKGQVKIIRIDIDPVQAKKPSPPDLCIVAKAREALGALANRAGAANRTRPSPVDRLNAVRAEVRTELAGIEPQASFMSAVREQVPEDGIFVTDITQMANYFRYAGPFYTPRALVPPGSQGTLGFSFATALGAQVAHPGRRVVALAGDGGFLFTVQELSTAVQFNIPVVTIVFSDGAYGNVKHMQKTRYGSRYIAVDLRNPDFVALAQSFGALGFRAQTPEALRDAMRAGFDANRPTLIEVPIGEVPNMSSLVPRPRGDGTTVST